MVTEIKYSGITANPSDYLCPDGELDCAAGLIPEDGELHRVADGGCTDKLQAGEKLLLIHVADDTKNRIIAKGTELYFVREGEETRNTLGTFPTENFRVSATGNILCVYGTGRMEHFLYEKKKYISYETDLSVNILFGLGDARVDTSPGQLQRVNDLFSTTYGSNDYDWKERQLLTWTNQESAFPRWTLGSPAGYGDRYMFKLGGTVYWHDSVEQANSLVFEILLVDNRNPGHYPSVDEAPSTISIRKYSGFLHNGDSWSVKTESNESFNEIWIYMFGNYGNGFIEGRFYSSLEADGSSASAFAENIWLSWLQPTIVYNDINFYYLALSGMGDTIDVISGYLGEVITNVKNSDRFMFPFFVRYGFRLKDDNIVVVSQPALMEPNTGVVPTLAVNILDENRESETRDALVQARAFSAVLKYRVVDNEKLEYLFNSDIIKSVVVAASLPLWQYKQGATYREITSNSHVVKYEYPNKCYSLDGVKKFDNNVSAHVMMPQVRSDWSYEKQLEDKSGSYYIISEIKKDKILYNNEFNEVPIDKGTLNNLEQEKLANLGGSFRNLDAYDTNYCMSYNLREHQIGLRGELFTGFSLDTMCGVVKCDPHTANYEFKYDDGTVRHGRHTVYSSNRRWLSLPKRDITKMTVYENGKKYSGIEMKNLANVTGSFHFGSIGEGASDTEGIVNLGRKSVIFARENYMRITKLANPAAIAQELRVGDGKLIAAASSTRPVSRGQAGTGDLFVFSTDGIWAITPNKKDGEYSVVQPISRDVLTDPGSITCIDDAVLFATERGIVAVSDADRGSMAITDTIMSDDWFTPSELPRLKAVIDRRPEQLAAFREKPFPLGIVPTELQPFRLFIEGARMLYDYQNQRIILYNPSLNYAYIYSLRSKQWGMRRGDIAYAVNAYPECIAVDWQGKVINFSKPSPWVEYWNRSGGVVTEHGVSLVSGEIDYAETISAGGKEYSWNEIRDAYGEAASSGLLVTRPLKLGMPDQLKTVNTVIQRGNFQKGHVKTVLYGSSDLIHWHLVASSKTHILRGLHGTPYKYFRIVLLTNLSMDESITSCTIGYTPKQTNQLR